MHWCHLFCNNCSSIAKFLRTIEAAKNCFYCWKGLSFRYISIAGGFFCKNVSLLSHEPQKLLHRLEKNFRIKTV
jgi:hypothetical protein